MKNALFQTERIIKALAKNYTHEKTAAIILAAGKGTRAGGDVSKQLTEINGIPVAVRTIIKFQNCNIIDDIIIITEHKMQAIAHIVLTEIIGDSYMTGELKINAITNIADIIAAHFYIITMP